MKIGLILPSNRPDTCDKMVFSTESLGNLSGLSATFLAAFQDPVSELDAARFEGRCKDHGLGFRCTWREQNGTPSMFDLRQTAADLMPDADVFVFIDDNFEFLDGAAAVYDEVARFCCDVSDASVIQCQGSLGGGSFGRAVKRSTTHHWTGTERGLFLRNDFDGLIFPRDALGLVGGYEELIAAYWRINKFNYYKRFFVPVKHSGRTKTLDMRNRFEPTGNAVGPIHDLQIAEQNAFAYLRELEPKWKPGRKLFKRCK